MNNVLLAMFCFVTLEGGSRIYVGKHRFAEALMSEIALASVSSPSLQAVQVVGLDCQDRRDEFRAIPPSGSCWSEANGNASRDKLGWL